MFDRFCRSTNQHDVVNIQSNTGMLRTFCCLFLCL